MLQLYRQISHYGTFLKMYWPTVYLLDNLMTQNTLESFLFENYAVKKRGKKSEKDCCHALCIFLHIGLAEQMFNDNVIQFL